MNLITFPTDFGKRRIVCYNKEQLNKLINEWNGKTACFASVYTSQQIIPTPVIDRVFFDFDNEFALHSIITLHNKLLDEDIKHYMQMSGSGFHCFIFTKPYDEGDEIHKKAKVRAAQNMYTNWIDDNKKMSYYLTIDKKVMGDINRLFRIPNTYNCRAKRYCIPITREMLYWSGLTLYRIREFAKNPHYSFRVYGKKLLDLHDIEIVEEENSSRINVEVDINDDELPLLLPCTQYIIQHTHPSHDQKVAAIADLKFAITLGQDCNRQELLQQMENIIWKHCKWADLNSITETRRQIKCVINGITFGYGCKTKRNDFNMCIEGCNIIDNS